jgi:hypothetical protein
METIGAKTNRVLLAVAGLVVVIGAGVLLTTRKEPHVGAPADILTNGTKLYSHFTEELIIRHALDDMRNGFYLDVGCFDWKIDSNTLYLEEHLGWSGIAIDAQAYFAEGWKANRPRARFFSYLRAR